MGDILHTPILQDISTESPQCLYSTAWTTHNDVTPITTTQHKGSKIRCSVCNSAIVEGSVKGSTSCGTLLEKLSENEESFAWCVVALSWGWNLEALVIQTNYRYPLWPSYNGVAQMLRPMPKLQLLVYLGREVPQLQGSISHWILIVCSWQQKSNSSYISLLLEGKDFGSRNPPEPQL